MLNPPRRRSARYRRTFSAKRSPGFSNLHAFNTARMRLSASLTYFSVVRLEPGATRSGDFGTNFRQRIPPYLAARMWYSIRHGHVFERRVGRFSGSSYGRGRAWRRCAWPWPPSRCTQERSCTLPSRARRGPAPYGTGPLCCRVFAQRFEPCQLVKRLTILPPKGAPSRPTSTR